MMHTAERKKTALCLLAALLVVLLLQLYLWPHVADDAYISFRYAWNLSHGHGLVSVTRPEGALYAMLWSLATIPS